MSGNKLSIMLWFDSQAEDAADFYVSIFKDAKIISITNYGKEGFEHHQRPEGSVMLVDFELNGQVFKALNGGPHFKFTEAVSFMVECKDQEEIDYYWDKLSAGGDLSAQQCGWLKDKFGVSWQIVPVNLENMMNSSDYTASQRVMKEIFRMKKLDIDILQNAFNDIKIIV